MFNSKTSLWVLEGSSPPNLQVSCYPRHLHTSCPFPGHSCTRVFSICLPPHSSLYLTPPKPGFMTQCKYCLRRAIRYVPTPTKQRFIGTEVQGVWQRWHGTENITLQRTLSWEAPLRRAIWCLHRLTLTPNSRDSPRRQL